MAARLRDTHALVLVRLDEGREPALVVAAAIDGLAETLSCVHEDARIVSVFDRLAEVLHRPSTKARASSRFARIGALSDALDAPAEDPLVEQAKLSVVEALVSTERADETQRAAVARFVERVILGALEPALAERPLTLEVQAKHRAAAREWVTRASLEIAGPARGTEPTATFLARGIATMLGAGRGAT